MGRTFTLTQSNQYLPGIRKHTVNKTFFVGPTTVRLLLVVIAGLLAVSYIASATSNGTRYLDLNTLQEEKQSLQTKHQTLEYEAAQLQSLPSLEQVAPQLKLEPISKAEYLPKQGVAQADNHGG